jgi:hypothetical protein
LKLCRALGYDMNTVEWAVRDGVPYAIDFMNCAPDMDINSLTPHYFDWTVQHMADMAIRLAHEPRPQRRDMKWDTMFTSSRWETPAKGALATRAPERSGASATTTADQGNGSAHIEQRV